MSYLSLHQSTIIEFKIMFKNIYDLVDDSIKRSLIKIHADVTL